MKYAILTKSCHCAKGLNMTNNKSKKKKRWLEWYAKYVLESVFPNRFYQLDDDERPDLQSLTLNVGIEVTSAVSSIVRENDGLFSRLTFQNPTPKNRERSLNRIRSMGGKYYDEGYMINWAGERDIKEVYSAFEDKLTKLNNGTYTIFAKQYVFIAENDLITYDYDIKEIYLELKKRQEGSTIRFDSVFLLIDWCILVEINIEAGENQQYRIDNYRALADKAFQMVNG